MTAMRNLRQAGPRAIPFGRLAIVVQTLAAIAFVVYLFAGKGVHVPVFSDRYTVQVAFDDAAGVSARTANAVLINGVRVGKVVGVRYDDGEAVATLELNDSSRGHLRRDARAEVVPRSALQDQLVDLRPGSAPQPLPEGARIPAHRTTSPISLDQVVSTLDADTRAQVTVLLDQLRVGLKGRSTTLRAALAELAPAVDSTARVARALADRRRLLAQLVGELDAVFGTLAAHQGALADVVAAGRRTLDTTSRRDAELARTTRALPGTLAALGGALDELRGLAGPLESGLQSLRPAARRLPGGLRALRELVPTARGLIDDLAPVVRDGRRPVRDLRRALTALRPAATGLRQPVAQVLPVLQAVDRNKEGVGRLGENFSGVFSTNDANGAILRGLGFFEEFNPANVGAPGATGARLRHLEAQAVAALLKACRSNALACLARYLIPGLPGSVRSVAAPLGDAGLARRATARLLQRPQLARLRGLTPTPNRWSGG